MVLLHNVNWIIWTVKYDYIFIFWVFDLKFQCHNMVNLLDFNLIIRAGDVVVKKDIKDKY